MAQLLCTMASARPRQWLGQVSATRVAPAFHCPPIPSPNKNRKQASMVTLVENPHAKVKSEYVKMHMLIVRRRPSLSEKNPNRKPPRADATSVSVFSNPAVPFVIPNSRIKVASTMEYSMTSNESSIQPSPAATTVRRCADEVLLQRRGRTVEASKTIG